MRGDLAGERARVVVQRPGGGEVELPGGLIHYRMADGADDIEFTGRVLDLELLLDPGGEAGWLRISHFHRAERHGLSWLRHRLATARVGVAAGWRADHPAWRVSDDSGELVLELVVEQALRAGAPPGPEGAERGVRGLVWQLLAGPPGEPERSEAP